MSRRSAALPAREPTPSGSDGGPDVAADEIDGFADYLGDDVGGPRQVLQLSDRLAGPEGEVLIVDALEQVGCVAACLA